MERFRQFPWAAAAGVAAVVVVLVILVSSASRRPAPRPGPVPEPRREEPTVSLFVAETGKTKSLKMEEYIAGVVAAEMDPKWPRQALAAQAILARTFTLHKMDQGKTRHGTDASTDVKEFQAYDSSRINDMVRAAVQDTRGEVITHKGRFIRAWFHSCAGGMTATAEEGLGFTGEAVPYVKVVRDPPCANPQKQNWTASFSKNEVMSAARKAGAQVSDLDRIRVADRGPSGRATKLDIGGTVVGAPEFRVAIGPDRMKSTLLESLRVEGDRVVMRGRGWGHGVGVSQFGALDKAKKGWDAERIIGYYFDGIDIRKLWD